MHRLVLFLALLSISCTDLARFASGPPARVEVERNQAQELDFAQATPPAIVRDIGRNAAALMEWADTANLWNDVSPSSNSHRLLACGARCESGGTNGSLVEAWVLSATEPELHKLHRGEFLASLATAEVAIETRLPRLGDATVESRLREQLGAALAVSPSAWNDREAPRGTEFGWLLQASCHYHGANLGLRAKGARQLLSKAISASRVAATEAGTHELEGLAACLRAHATHGPSTLDTSYALVHSFLKRRMTDDLNAQKRSGQLYAEHETFDTCEGELCEVLGDTNRQAHFFEWATLVPGANGDPRLEAPLERLRELTSQALEQLPASRSPEPWLPLMASAATHTSHVSLKLQQQSSAH